MKKLLCIVMILMLLISAMSCTEPSAKKPSESAAISSGQPSVSVEPSVSETPSIVVFTDAVLEEQIRKAMNKTTGDITLEEAEAVESFDFKVENPGDSSIARIKDISALKYFKNLKSLNLSYNLIEDLSPLAEMKNLEALYYFDASSVKNFSVLAELTNMLDIIIHSDTFTNADMQSMSGMTNIELLWISAGKELTNISVVQNFKKLYKLNIENSGVSDISSVSGITSLVEMSLRGSHVSDISPLKDLVNLKTLLLEGCPVTDYSPIKDIYPNLESKDFEIK